MYVSPYSTQLPFKQFNPIKSFKAFPKICKIKYRNSCISFYICCCKLKYTENPLETSCMHT